MFQGGLSISFSIGLGISLGIRFGNSFSIGINIGIQIGMIDYLTCVTLLALQDPARVPRARPQQRPSLGEEEKIIEQETENRSVDPGKNR